MDSFDNKTKQWNVVLPPVAYSDIADIVGMGTPVTISSDGKITFGRALTAKEKTDIEALMLAKTV